MKQEEIKQIIKSTFAPYHCGIEFIDYYDLKFKVYNENNKPIIDEPRLKEVYDLNENELKLLLSPYKEKMKSEGYNFD